MPARCDVSLHGDAGREVHRGQVSRLRKRCVCISVLGPWIQTFGGDGRIAGAVGVGEALGNRFVTFQAGSVLRLKPHGTHEALLPWSPSKTSMADVAPIAL